MPFYDSFMIPVIASDSNGRVVYKNSAARRCIPTPRMGADIDNFINRKMDSFRFCCDGVCVEYLKNDSSIFSRAFVVEGSDSERIWCFLPELQLSEPEDITAAMGEAILPYIKSCIPCFVRDDKKPAELLPRCHKLTEELLSLMKYIDLENRTEYFHVSDILTSVKDKTSELSKRLNYRISVDMGLTDPVQIYTLSFRPFAAVYSQLLHLVLRISARSECHISINQTGKALNILFASSIGITDRVICPGSELKELSKLFPQELLNTVFLDASISFHNYGIEYSLNTNGEIIFRFSVPLDQDADSVISQIRPLPIYQSRLHRAQKRAMEYMDAVFMQICAP